MLDAIIAGGANTSTGSICCKEGTVRLHRCRDCFDSTPVCGECIVDAHRSNPFHSIETWTGTYFKKSSLADLGFKLHLMHSGERCPYNDEHVMGDRVEIVHTNGLHFLCVVQCSCLDRPSKLIQYTRSMLLPASAIEPRVCFSFALMKDFQIHTLTSKKSAYDYILAIRRKTNALVSDVPVSSRYFFSSGFHMLNVFSQDPYPQFMRVMRLWRLLTIEKRSGRAFGIDDYVKFRPKGSIALPCLPCPYPGFNMAPNWLDDVLTA